MTSVELAIQTVYQLQSVKYVSVASAALFFTDFIITFESEVRDMWPAPWDVGKVLFFITRYTPFMDLPASIYQRLAFDLSHGTCHAVYSYGSWLTLVGIGSAEAVLCLRTYALYGRSRGILIFLLFFWLLPFAGALVILQIFLNSLKFGPPPFSFVSGCTPSEGKGMILFIDFLLIALFELVILILTLYKGIKTFRASLENSTLAQVLLRDGLNYFFLLFCVSMGNIMVLIFGGDNLTDLLTTVQRVLHSVAASRVLLHVRAAGRPLDSRTQGSSLSYRGWRYKRKVNSSGETTDSGAPITTDIELENHTWRETTNVYEHA